MANVRNAVIPSHSNPATSPCPIEFPCSSLKRLDHEPPITQGTYETVCFINSLSSGEGNPTGLLHSHPRYYRDDPWHGRAPWHSGTHRHTGRRAASVSQPAASVRLLPSSASRSLRFCFSLAAGIPPGLFSSQSRARDSPLAEEARERRQPVHHAQLSKW